MNIKWSLIVMLVALIPTVLGLSAFFTQRKEHKGEKYTRYENRLLLIALFGSAFFVIGFTNILCKQFGMSADLRNSWIMVWLCVPLALVSTIFMPWLLEYLCSINTVLSGKVVPKLVTTSFEGDTSLNLGVTSLGKFLVYVAWGIPAVAFWALPKFAAAFIEYWEYGIESQLNLLANGTTIQKLMLAGTIGLFFVAIYCGYSYFNNIYKNVKEWLKNSRKYKNSTLPYPVKNTERRFLISLLVFKLYIYWYLYSFNKVAIRNALLWLILLLVIGALRFINNFVRSWKKSSGTAGTTGTANNGSNGNGGNNSGNSNGNGSNTSGSNGNGNGGNSSNGGNSNSGNGNNGGDTDDDDDDDVI